MAAACSAQAPAVIYNMAHAAIDERTLYIQGGSFDTLLHNRKLYALDLTQVNEDTSSSAWRVLDEGTDPRSPLSTSDHTMAVSKDKQNLMIVTSAGTISTFNIASSTWQEPTAVSQLSATMGPRQAVTDPSTGLVYIPGGFNSEANMAVYNPADRSVSTTIPLPSRAAGLSFYAAAWSTVRQSIVLYGGIDTEDQYSNLIEYQPTNSKWVNLQTTGPSPGNISSPCIVPAYDGTKFIVFGGISTASFTALGGIYLLDAQNLTWTRGSDAETSQNRVGMACAVAGDYFIAWGGTNNAKTSLEPLIMYNLKTNTWEKQITESERDRRRQTSRAERRRRSAIIGGGVSAGIVTVAAIGFSIHKRQQLRRTSPNKEYLAGSI
ncbi:hypothetical protein BGZ68_009519 [Mortierella alpina]|nr:hypothetical protein BGZ68_009519 [Mortierella alpina]